MHGLPHCKRMSVLQVDREDSRSGRTERPKLYFGSWFLYKPLLGGPPGFYSRVGGGAAKNDMGCGPANKRDQMGELERTRGIRLFNLNKLSKTLRWPRKVLVQCEFVQCMCPEPRIRTKPWFFQVTLHLEVVEIYPANFLGRCSEHVPAPHARQTSS